MRRWWVKAAAQGALAAVPGGETVDDLLRRRFKTSLRADYVKSKWRHVRSHLKSLSLAPGMAAPAGVRAVELGTGWFPVVPLGLALHGIDVVSIDVRALLDRRRVTLTFQAVLDLVDHGEVTVPGGPRLDVLRALVTEATARGRPVEVEAALSRLGITVCVADARDLSGVPQALGADVMVSNNTLEHIPARVLRGIFAEFHRVGSSRASMSHYVDLADHYAGFDPRIGEFHFLTLSERGWRLANNRLGYQNRLRIADYVRLAEETGWRVLRRRDTRRDDAALDGLTLRPPYEAMPREELLVVRSHLVAVRA